MCFCIFRQIRSIKQQNHGALTASDMKFVCLTQFYLYSEFNLMYCKLSGEFHEKLLRTISCFFQLEQEVSMYHWSLPCLSLMLITKGYCWDVETDIYTISWVQLWCLIAKSLSVIRSWNESSRCSTNTQFGIANRDLIDRLLNELSMFIRILWLWSVW